MFFVAFHKPTLIKRIDFKLDEMVSLLKVSVHASLSSCRVIIDKVMSAKITKQIKIRGKKTGEKENCPTLAAICKA